MSSYSWPEYPVSGSPQFEYAARTSMETWRTNSEAMEGRINVVEASLLPNSLNGNVIVNDTISYTQIETVNDPSVTDTLMVWNNAHLAFEFVAPDTTGDTYQVKDNASDLSPGFLEDKLSPYLSNENLFINPNYKVNQEGYVDGAAITSGDHIHDGWQVPNSSDSLFNISVSGENISLDNSSGSAFSKVQQINDDILKYADGTILTLSLNVTSASGATSINGIGIPSTAVGSVDTYVVTFAKDTADTDFDNEPWFKIAPSAGAAITFDSLKLEAASIETKYEVPFLTAEWLKSRRYLRTVESASGHSHSTNEGRLTVNLDSPMATINTTVIIDSGIMYTIDGLSSLSGGNGILDEQTDNSVVFDVSGSIPVTNSTPLELIGPIWLDARPT